MRERVGMFYTVLVLLWAVVAAPPALAGSHEKTFEIERDATALTGLTVENLIGSVDIGASVTPDRMRIEARIVVEAKSPEAAKLIADSVRLDETLEDGRLNVRVAFGDDSIDRFRLPRSEKGGLLAKWIEPLVRKNQLVVEYGDRTVRVGRGKEGLAIAVHLKVKLPVTLAASFSQTVGTARVESAGGDVELRVVQGRLEVDQFFGKLVAVADAASIDVRNHQGDLLEIRSESGKIDLNEIRAKTLDVQAGSGRILGASIKADEAIVLAKQGNVALSEFEPARMDVTAESGNVELATRMTGTEAGVIRSDTGNVTLRLGDTAWFDLAAETRSGEIKQRDVDLIAVGREGAAALYRRGRGGADIEVRAANGELSVRPYDGSWIQSLMQSDK